MNGAAAPNDQVIVNVGKATALAPTAPAPAPPERSLLFKVGKGIASAGLVGLVPGAAFVVTSMTMNEKRCDCEHEMSVFGMVALGGMVSSLVGGALGVALIYLDSTLNPQPEPVAFFD